MRETALGVHSYFERSPADTVAPSICLARSVVPRERFRSLAQGGRRRHRRNLRISYRRSGARDRVRTQFSHQSSAPDHPTIDRRNVSLDRHARSRPAGWDFSQKSGTLFKNVRRAVCFAVSTMLRASCAARTVQDRAARRQTDRVNAFSTASTPRRRASYLTHY
jgi:hypothetical protein